MTLPRRSLLTLALLPLLSSPALAVGPVRSPSQPIAGGIAADELARASEPQGESDLTLGLFQAIESGKVTARFIPLDQAGANVLVRNHTDKPIRLKIPDAIAAVPVLGQLQNFGQQNGGVNGAGGAGSQAVGGNFNGNQGQGNQGFGNQFGGGARQNDFGFMRVGPQKMRKLTATTVCLEYGKREPNPKLEYRLIPIARYSNDACLIELCRGLGQASLSPRSAQAAAWHLANGLTWERLAEINRIESRYLGTIKYFRRSELKSAQEWVAEWGQRSLSRSRDDSSEYSRDTAGVSTANRDLATTR